MNSKDCVGRVREYFVEKTCSTRAISLGSSWRWGGVFEADLDDHLSHLLVDHLDLAGAALCFDGSSGCWSARYIVVSLAGSR